MSVPVVAEDSTISVISAAEVYFQLKPRDTRFDDVEYREFMPIYSVANSRTVEFDIAAQATNKVLLFHEHVLEVKLRLTKPDGSILEEGRFCAIANNGIDTLWSQVNVSLNGTQINKSTRNHGYRAYIPKALSYPKSAKNQWMQTEMWAEDQIYKFDPVKFDDTCTGLRRRMNFFKERGYLPKNKESTRKYSNKYFTMFGRVFTDLNTCESGILPGVGVKLEMVFAEDSFRLVSNKPDPIKLEVLGVKLHIPIATLNARLWESIDNRMKNEPSTCFYNRTELLTHTINSGVNSYEVALFNSTVAGPARLIIIFVTTKQFNGHILENPWKFSRVWRKDIPASGGTPAQKITSWVSSVTLTVNGKTIDSLKPTGDEFDDLASYLRLNLYQGVQNTSETNGIDYANFLDNSSLFIFDLTTSNKFPSIQDFWVPCVKSGDIRVEVAFGGNPLPTELKMISYCEFPSVFKVSRGGAINFSYFSTSVK